MSVHRLTCPKCRRRAYPVCTNRKCRCWSDVPKGNKPLRWTRDGEGNICPYCRFRAHVDYWFDRSMRPYETKDPR
jgi:hypothetical protein